jgi:hypothetical protein
MKVWLADPVLDDLLDERWRWVCSCGRIGEGTSVEEVEAAARVHEHRERQQL